MNNPNPPPALKSPFNRWFRLVGTPLFGLLIYLIIYYLDPRTFEVADYTGPDAWKFFCIDLVTTLGGAYLLSETSIWVTQGLNRLLPWERQPLLRFVAQLLTLAVASVAVIWLIIRFLTLLEPTYRLTEHDELSIRQTLVFGSLMALFLNAIHTGEYFFGRWRTATLEAETLKRESAEARYEALKSQLDPHFLFNNLNTLLYLVEDNRPAVAFVENLALVYRYVLQNRDKTLVPLADELQLARAYLALLQERFGEGIRVSIDIPAAQLDRHLPPMTLQLLLENAVKHNVVDAKSPLHITIRLNDAGELAVENSLRRRPSPNGEANPSHQLGIGLQNIRHRYQLSAHVQPTVSETAGLFSVRLPLLTIE